MGDLTYEEAHRLFRYNRSTGVVTRRVSVHYKAQEGDEVGSPNNQGYLQVTVRQKKYKLHRVIWLMVKGEWPEIFIDHRDTDKANNRWRNLRLASNAKNCQNRFRSRAGNSTGFIGASRCRSRFSSAIGVDSDLVYLGCFRSAEEAHIMYCFAKQFFHPEVC